MNNREGKSDAVGGGSSKKPSHVQEFSIRVPKTQRKKHHVMRFNATLNVDFAQWKVVKLERENNMKEFKSLEEDQPKFGAGSEYNRDLREEARKKKFGIISKKYRADQQPWILKVGGKPGKKFKGIREGGVGENASFYVFTHAPDGTIEAYPLNEWYNFQPINRYKSLTAEEAEQEFGRRKKVMNFFSLMLRKRLKGDETEEVVEEEAKSKMSGKKSKELKISDMDEWIEDSDSDSDSDSNGNDKKAKNDDSDDDTGGKNKNKKDAKGKKEKKKKRDLDDEAFEESDDGDEEGREMDYDTESSEDVPDPEDKINKELKSVAEEDALRKLLSSDEDEEEENKSENESDKEKNKEKEESKEKKKSKKSKPARKDSSSDSYIDSSDSESETMKKKSVIKDSSSRSVTPTTLSQESNKRKIVNNMPSDLNASDNSNSPLNTPAKKMKTDPSVPSSFSGVVNSNNKDDFGITEEAVRRYLMRKPMTATELLTKFKNKKTGLSSERLVETMTQILKRISPTKQTIQGKMYLSISQK